MQKKDVILRLDEDIANLITDQRTIDAISAVLSKLLRMKSVSIDLQVSLLQVEEDLRASGMSEDAIKAEIDPVRRLVGEHQLRSRAIRILKSSKIPFSSK